MDLNFTSLVDNVAFPILMCLILCWYVYQIQSKLVTTIEELEDIIKSINESIGRMMDYVEQRKTD